MSVATEHFCEKMESEDLPRRLSLAAVAGSAAALTYYGLTKVLSLKPQNVHSLLNGQKSRVWRIMPETVAGRHIRQSFWN